MSVEKSVYGKMNGKDVAAFTICNKNGTKAAIIEKGATLDKLFVKAKNGGFFDVLVGHDTLEGHIERSDYQGVVVGRFANRISNGSFVMDGKTYNVTKNEKDITCLHGGGEFSFAHWSGEILSDKAVCFTYESPENSEGFPGKVTAKVVYELSDNDELFIKYDAVSDKKTPLNLTNHAYFNLNGTGSGSILEHSLKLFADRFTPIDENSIPTGELRPVNGTPFSFETAKKIGKDIEADDEQLKNGNGYDHNFCLTNFDGTLKTAAVAVGDKTNIKLTVKTDLPGVQLYTGNFLDGTVIGKNGAPLTKRCAFCLETQVFPNSLNHPEWHQKCFFDAGEHYKSTTVFAFSVE